MTEHIAPPPYLTSAAYVRTLVKATARVVQTTLDDHTMTDPALDDPASDGSVDEARAADVEEVLSVPLERVGDLDADAVAAWVVGQYQGRVYPGVVMGSRHGAAIHLAAALGLPWLPTGFEVDVRWIGGRVTDVAGAMAYGNAAAVRVLRANPDLSVRQVHDPVGMGAVAGVAVNLHLRWRRLPHAYRRFLDTHLERGGPILVVADTRPWPVLDVSAECSFQLGSVSGGLTYEDYLAGPDLRAVMARSGGIWRAPQATWRPGYGEHGVEFGLEAAVRRWARAHDAPVCSMRYHGAGMLSAAVADFYREWLRGNGFRADRLVVETGRRLDPGRVLHSGMVPYWCESGTRAAVTEAELWVAASSQFTRIDVLDEPVGRPSSRLASTAQWSALSRFAIRPAAVDEGLLGALVLRRLSGRERRQPRQPRHPLGDYRDDGARPRPLTPSVAIAALRANAGRSGLRVSGSPGA